MNLMAGDVILARPNSLLGRLVVKFETLFGDPAEFSHVGIVSRPGRTDATNPLEQPWVTEALWTVETAPWSKNWTGRDVTVYRRRDLSPAQRENLGALAEEYTGRGYGWWKLVLIAADAYLSRRFEKDMRVFSRLIHRESSPFCSMLVQEVYYDEIGELFGVPRYVAQPDDIGDWCFNDELNYEWVK